MPIVYEVFRNVPNKWEFLSSTRLYLYLPVSNFVGKAARWGLQRQYPVHVDGVQELREPFHSAQTDCQKGNTER